MSNPWKPNMIEQSSLEELKNRNSTLEQIMETSPVGIILLDLDGIIFQANKRAEEILGINLSDDGTRTYNDPAWKIIDVTGAPLPQEKLPFFMVKQTQKPVFGVRHGIQKPDGRQVILSINAAPLFDADGNLTGVVTAVEDITRQTFAEKRYQMLFKEMTTGFALHEMIYDDSGRPVNYRFLDVNPAFEQLTGLKASDIIGKTVLEVLPDNEPDWVKIYGGVALTGDPVSFESYSKSIARHFQVTAFRPEPGQFACIFSDITQIKTMEAELVKVQKMEAIGILAGGIAHDFNNILFPIIGLTEMLIEGDLNDPQGKEHLHEILKAGNRAKELIKQILTISRQNTAETIYPIDVKPIIKEVLKLSKSTLPSTIRVVEKLSDNCGHVMADPVHIHQILMNLITNAFHAMEVQGGFLTVSLDTVDTTFETLPDLPVSHRDHICITVSDTGIGMDGSILQNMFVPYFSTKKKDKGTGLGLAVVNGIVKNLGGDIMVESHPGKGSTIRILLPRISPSILMEKKDPSFRADFSNRSALIVDDEVTIVRFLKLMLTREGFQVSTFMDSRKALETFVDTPDRFDIIITDMTMPDMTGIDLADRLKRIRPDIPIIMCTGYNDEIIGKTMEKTVDRILIKPVSKNLLLKSIRDLIY